MTLLEIILRVLVYLVTEAFELFMVGIGFFILLFFMAIILL